MRHEPSRRPAAWRWLALIAIFGAGLATIVGSGGGGGGANCSFFSDYCNFGGPVTPIAYASVTPSRQTVQVGTSAVFRASVIGIGIPSYTWCRSANGGTGPCVAIAGATGSSYTLAGANLADDDVVFLVTASGDGLSASAGAHLLVSAQPAVLLADTDFADANWVATAVATPASSAAAHAEVQTATGGNPGAFRRLQQDLPAGPSALRVNHLWQVAAYDPATQGAILAIDVAQDALSFSPGLPGDATPYVSPLIEQAGRRYVLEAWRWSYANPAAWARVLPSVSLTAADFVLADGPACVAGAACPDFSASAVALRFGFAVDVDLAAGTPAVSVACGVDNWKVTVWRR